MSDTIRAMPRRRAARRRPRRAVWLTAAAVIVVLLFATPALVNLLVNYWWFRELGYGNVYTTELAAGWTLGVVGAVIAFAILWSLAQFVARVARAQGRTQAYRGRVHLVVDGALVVLALLAGLGLSGDWQRVLFWIHQAPFGVRDPVFHHDVAFYVFTLPLLQDLLAWLGVVLFIGLIVALVLLYSLDLGHRLGSLFNQDILTGQVVGNVQFDVRWLRPYLTVVSLWFALLALLISGSNWLMRYNSLVSPGDGFQGGSYTDLHAGVPGWTILSALGVLAAILLLINAFAWRRWLLVAGAIAGWIVAWVLLVGLVPAVVNAIKVNPAPLAAEAPQIGHNIVATRAAFNLRTVTASDFPAATITTAQMAADRAGVDSLRVVDQGPFQDAALQQQAIRLYYDFPTVGLDRYRVGGVLRQVLIAPRELSQDQLPTTAQTWQNFNFTYTHGYGLVMAPVNTVAADGSPLYWIKDIPPRANSDAPISADLPRVTRPQIYFGLDTNKAVFVKTGAQEFDYSTDFNEYHNPYAGTAGIPIGGALQRLAWVIYFNSPIQIGTTSYLTSTSRVLLHRNITDRLNTLAPFITFDTNPYLVLDTAGRPTWIVDGYTTSSDYPYSEPYGGDSVSTLSGINYIRNAVKATIDPYNGTVRLYVVDSSDAIVRTIANAFPSLVRPFAAMPADLRAHIRYPVDLFNTQFDVFERYHQTEPQAWYNNEDQWTVPSVGDNNGNTAPVASYYAVTRLPGNLSDEFVLMRPYTPLNKSNMVSLLVGRSDSPNYGKLIVYRFPLGRQILGPQQLQATIQQKPDFSQDITLWNQQGSHVHFGNIIVAPVATGLLYLEPLYLQAENSRIPQLQRVIAYANGKLVWGSSLDNALGQIFGTAAPPARTAVLPPTATGSVTGTVGISGTVAITGGARGVLLQIQAHLAAAQAAAGRGDWVTYGREQAIAYRLLQQALGQSR